MTLESTLWLENIGPEYNAREFRHLLRTLCEDTSGVTRAGDLKVVQRGAGANLSVDVGIGDAYIVGTENANQGAYHQRNNAVVNVTGFTPDGSQARHVIVGIRVQDSEYSGGVDGGSLVLVHGTPAGTPADPPLPASFCPLARVVLPAAAASVTTAMIQDMRSLTAPARNGRGRITRQVFNLDTGTITTLVPVNGSAVGIDGGDGGRRVELKAILQWRSSQVGDAIEVHFRDNGGNIHGAQSVPVQTVAQDMTWEVTTDWAPTAGGHVVDMTVARLAGTGLPRIQGVASVIVAYDVGGARV